MRLGSCISRTQARKLQILGLNIHSTIKVVRKVMCDSSIIPGLISSSRCGLTRWSVPNGEMKEAERATKLVLPRGIHA